MTKINDLLSTNHPKIMGIINVTPDSFYDGGLSHEHLKKRIDEFNELNIQMIDIGAESSRPGATPISSDEEIKRLNSILPYIVTHSNAIISVDTTKVDVAEYVLRNGAHFINDISGGESDELLQLIGSHNAGIIIMHKQGQPQTMQVSPEYDDVVNDVKGYFRNQIKRAESFGISSIIIDPGIGFGKRLEHNISIMKNIDAFLDLNTPILIGSSNKSFIEHLTGAPVDERIPGSIASVLATYQRGATIFRVHNVKETIQALDVFRAIHE